MKKIGMKRPTRGGTAIGEEGRISGFGIRSRAAKMFYNHRDFRVRLLLGQPRLLAMGP